MTNSKSLLVMAAIALAPTAGAAATVNIDTFLTDQQAITPEGFGITATTSVAAAEAIGGNRTITVTGNGSVFPTNVTGATVGNGTASVSNGSGVTGTALFEWAAGGVDFTANGLNDTFVLDINSLDLDNVVFDLTVDGSMASSGPVSGGTKVTFAFSEFGDLANADAVSLLISGPAEFDVDFTFFGARDLIANPQTTTPVPLPASGLLLASFLLGTGVMARRRKS